MITENLSTLKIHKLTKEQYDRAAANGNINGNALYLTPDEVVTPIVEGGTGASTVEAARENLGVAPAIEAKYNKGCYYRGDNEWINPPLESGSIYKTTERFLNRPVYELAVQTGTMQVGQSKTITTEDEYSGHSIIGIVGATIDGNGMYRAIGENSLTFYVHVADDGTVAVTITNTSDYSFSADLILKFTAYN